MATLAAVRAALFPAATTARPLSAAEAEREIGWVRVLKARVPAFDALEAGDLAIVPGSALAVVVPDEPAARELAGALSNAGVPAVLLCGTAAATASPGAGGAALDALASAAEEAGVVALRLTAPDPVALERSVIAFLVNQRAELDRRAAELDGQLARLALQGGGLAAMAGAIGAFLGRAVAIEGPGGETLAVHAPAEPPSAAAAAARYLGRSLGSVAALRIVIPAVPGERGSGGRLLLLGDQPANDLDRVAGERAVALLGLELARAAAVDQARDELRRGEPLPSDGPPWVVILAWQGPLDLDVADDQAARERIRAGLRALAPARRLLLRGSAESLELRMVAAAPPDDPAAAVLAGRIAGYLHRDVAVSRPFPDPAARSAAEAAARAALEAAAGMDEPPRVALAANLPVYLLLGNLHNIPDAVRQSRALLAPLVEARAANRRQHLETLRALLEGGGAGEAAALLGVHRNTIAYRVEAIERATGWDLHDPDLRLALQVAIRLVQRDQRSGSDRGG